MGRRGGPSEEVAVATRIKEICVTVEVEKEYSCGHPDGTTLRSMVIMHDHEEYSVYLKRIESVLETLIDRAKGEG